ncbi:MAG: YitT family protein [Bacteroidales bacterium]|nr:YitT family protein [Bacteroidales bacterium]
MLRKVSSIIWDYFLIAVGVFIYVVAWTSFMLPQGMVSGGLTGACAILSMATGVPVDIYYITINALLIILATFVLGRSFGFKTIYAILVATILLRVLGSDTFNFMKSLPGEFFYVEDRALVPIIGGLLEAIGIGLIFQRGASTGGTDILALIINKFWPVSPGKVFLYSDLVIIATILLIPGHTFSDVIYGYIAMLVFSLGVDYVLMGRKSTVQVLIFSERYAEIADHINKALDRGVTALNAVGWYSKADRKVLLVMVRKYQLSEVTRAVKAIDSKAFVSVAPANDVYGEGFDVIKTGIQRKKKS